MKYYRLVHADDCGILCTEADLYGFDFQRLLLGQPIYDWDDRITLWYTDDGDAGDYMGNMVHWPVVSEHMRKVLLAVAPQEVQFYPVRVANRATGTLLEGYHACNILNCVPALDLEQATYNARLIDGITVYFIKKYAFRREVANRFLIFRPAESDITIVVSDKVRVALLANEITGVDFREAKLF